MPLELPAVRGKLLRDEPLGPYTWFRVGGPAEALFLPADEADLAALLRALPAEVQVTVLGVGSNVIVRDGGVAGVVVRLAGKAFGQIAVDPEAGRVTAGAAVPDAVLARACGQAGLGGLEFYAGIPGTIGGALTMNAGCYGRETKDVLVSARGLDRSGASHSFTNAEMGFSYRKSTPAGIIWLEATYQGEPADPVEVSARMAVITTQREGSQPIREKTGGSTFKNPDGHSAWKLVDEAGMRGARRGGAQVSEKHANFLINAGEASAADIEGLGEEVRAAVLAKTGVTLDWEIKRIGRT